MIKFLFLLWLSAVHGIYESSKTNNALETRPYGSTMLLQEDNDIDAIFDLFSEYSLSSLDYAIDLKEDELDQVKIDKVDLNTQIGISEDCENNTTCDSCTANDSCVWCPSSNTCVDGSVNGPYDDIEGCSDYEYEVCKFPDCDAYTSCNQCLNLSLIHI